MKVSEIPVGGRFVSDGMEMTVTCKKGTAVQAKIAEGVYQIFFGFEQVEPIKD